MFRTLALIVLVSFVGLGTSFGTAYWSAFRKNDGAEKAAPKIVQKKTRAINVPILAEGQVKGYVVAQFGYTAEEEALKSLPSAPDPLILDEAFRTTSYRCDITFNDDSSWTYEIQTELQVKGQPFDHHDTNTLQLIEPPRLNPLAVILKAGTDKK